MSGQGSQCIILSEGFWIQRRWWLRHARADRQLIQNHCSGRVHVGTQSACRDDVVLQEPKTAQLSSRLFMSLKRVQIRLAVAERHGWSGLVYDICTRFQNSLMIQWCKLDAMDPCVLTLDVKVVNHRLNPS